MQNKQREFEAIAEKKKEEEYLRNLEFQDKKVKLEKEIRLNKQHISEVTKEYNIGVLFNDQKEEELKNREEDKERYKGEELTMTKDTLKVDRRAAENFQIIELKINQEYLEDKTMKEKDENRLKLKKEEMQRVNRREEGKGKCIGEELSMKQNTSEIDKSVTQDLQESGVKISKECLEEICEKILRGKEQEDAPEPEISLEFENKLRCVTMRKIV